jgi:phospholipid/cholesterol/gamma-HCH transport system permease protein
MMNRIATLGHWAHFAVFSLLALIPAVFQPRLWARPLHRVFIGGLPLAAMTGLALGVVIWMHTRGVLEKSGTGAVEFLPTFLAAAVLLELAPIGAGLIVAARTGASLGAELAAMRINEQVDALELLGVSPLRRLIAPRVLACVLAVPLLHVLIATLALGSGYFAELIVGNTTWLKYQSAVLRELYLVDVIPALLKTLVFGFLVGVTGCYLGDTTRGGSEEVGTAATDSVVACSLLVLLADVFLVGFVRAFVA